jgi:hypothetical protein
MRRRAAELKGGYQQQPLVMVVSICGELEWALNDFLWRSGDL